MQVLDCVVYAERELLKLKPHLAEAKIFVHFQSSVKVGFPFFLSGLLGWFPLCALLILNFLVLQDLNSVECWGILGERSSWQHVPTSIMKRMVYRLLGRPHSPRSRLRH